MCEAVLWYKSRFNTKKKQSLRALSCLLCRENILVLDIFFEALNYEKIEQKKAYEIAGLLGKTPTLTVIQPGWLSEHPAAHFRSSSTLRWRLWTRKHIIKIWCSLQGTSAIKAMTFLLWLKWQWGEWFHTPMFSDGQYVFISLLLGDIGGQMGLFIGASVLTILEIFDYLYEVKFCLFSMNLKFNILF